MPQNDYTCPKCKFYYDTPNHELGCEGTPAPRMAPGHEFYQIPRVDPEENWKWYKDDLETYGQLDPQKVKEFAAHAEWARLNSQAFLQEDLQYEFSKPHTHASWVAGAIRKSFHDEKMYEVAELIEIMEGGGVVGDEDLIETVKNYFGYDEWKENQ